MMVTHTIMSHIGGDASPITLPRGDINQAQFASEQFKLL